MDLDWQFWMGLGLGLAVALVFLYRAAIRTLIEMANAEKALAQRHAIRERMQASLHVPPDIEQAIRDAEARDGKPSAEGKQAKPKLVVVR